MNTDPPMERIAPLLENNEPFPIQIDMPPKSAILLEGVSLEKLYALPSIDFLKSLKLRNFTDEKLKKSTRDIGAFVYFFKVIKANPATYESWM
jgi:hypothetical protein